jgi:hypothetical protein
MKILSTSYKDRFFSALHSGLTTQGTSSGLHPRMRISTREEHHIRNAFRVILLGAVLAIAIIFAFFFVTLF